MADTTKNYFTNQSTESKKAAVGGGVIVTDVDIRDLTATTDVVTIEGGNTYNVKVTLAGEVVDVTATDLDVRDLTSVTDSVAVEGGNVANVLVGIENEKVGIVDALQNIFLELRTITFLLNEGLNTKEDLDTLRKDFEADIGG